MAKKKKMRCKFKYRRPFDRDTFFAEKDKHLRARIRQGVGQAFLDPVKRKEYIEALIKGLAETKQKQETKQE